MAARQIRETWWVDFQFAGKRYRKRSPENTRRGASAYELTLRQCLARGEDIDRSLKRKSQTFAEFSAVWLEDYVKPNNKFSEQLAKKYVLASSLVPFFGERQIDQITSHDIERYKSQQAQQGFSNKTVMNRLTILNKCLVTAYEWLGLPGAAPKIKWPRWSLPEIDYLSPAECEQLLYHAEGVIREMILMALRTGMRQGELRGLQWSSIDWLTQTVAVRHSRDDYRRMLVSTKNGRTRHIPLDADLYANLCGSRRATGYVFNASDGQPFNNDRLNDAMGRVCKRAGLRRIGWHTLRHTFASHLAMRGVPLPAIKELMGHSSITTTMRYAHLAPSTLRAAIEMLNPKTISVHDLGQPGVNHWQELQRRKMANEETTPEYA